MAIFVFFENTSHNVLFYFSVLTAILYMEPQKFLIQNQDHLVPVIDAPIGSIKGTLLKSTHGRNIFSYGGIPYAEPPVGKLRFKRPKPIKGWKDGVFDGRGHSKKCVQLNGITPIPAVVGTEDCLQLNVYVPEVENPPKDGLSVMFWIHGGGFVAGEGGPHFYGPQHLLDKDVILVTINYRLGIFGYLTLGAEALGGNQAMWDQYEALKWVNKNIEAFGGNPKKVTIFGESAGGYSVSYHLTSRKSRGLFHSAIIQSGPLMTGHLRVDEFRKHADLHQEFSSAVGCPIEGNVEETVTCLQNKPVKHLMKNLKMFDQCNTLATGTMAYPVVWSPYDDHETVQDPFFAQHPVEILKSGEYNKVPIMIGTAKDEGVLHTATLLQDPEMFQYFKSNWDVCAGVSFLDQFFIDQPSKDLVKKAQKVKDFYFGSTELELDDWTFTNLTRAFTDSGFFLGTELMLPYLKDTKTYYYHLDHLGSFSMGDIFSLSKIGLVTNVLKKFVGICETKKLGVSHADDLLYLFK